MAKELTAKNFETEVGSATVPVIVDFWAQWCGPCRAQSPILDKLEQELGNNVKVFKVNVDEEETLARKFDVMTIPTLIVFQGGQTVKRVSGLQTLDSLKIMVSGK